MAPYRVLCADLVGAGPQIREELPIHDLKWSIVLDGPGAMSGWISLDDPKCTRANLDPGATALYIERGGLLVWGGILWAARPSRSSRKLMLAAEGFWSYFRRRAIRTTKVYTGADQLFIARDLVNYALAQPGSLTGITIGTETSGVLRDRSYPHYERKKIAEAIEQLSAVAGGFDFSIEVAWDTSGTTPQRTFKLYYPRRGARLDGLVFNGALTGVAEIEGETDATQLANLVDAIGAGDGDAMLIQTAADTSLLARYPLLEDSASFRDVNVTSTLQGHAVAQVGRRKFPAEIPKFTMQAGMIPSLGSYQVGDEGLVRVSEQLVQTSYQGLYLNLGVGISGVQYASCPDTPGTSITGDIDIRVRVAVDDWTPAATQSFITKWGSAGQIAFDFNVLATGVLRFTTSADGTATIAHDSTVAPVIADGSALWVRVTLTVNNGAAGHDVKFYTAPDSPIMPTSWTQLGTTVTTAGVTSLFDSNAALSIGAKVSGTVNRLAGKVYRAAVLNGIAGTTAADADFTQLRPSIDPPPAEGLSGALFTDRAGNLWSANGDATWVMTTIVRVVDGWLTYNGFYRVQEIEVFVGDDGQELVMPMFVSADAQVF